MLKRTSTNQAHSQRRQVRISGLLISEQLSPMFSCASSRDIWYGSSDWDQLRPASGSANISHLESPQLPGQQRSHLISRSNAGGPHARRRITATGGASMGRVPSGARRPGLTGAISAHYPGQQTGRSGVWPVGGARHVTWPRCVRAEAPGAAQGAARPLSTANLASRHEVQKPTVLPGPTRATDGLYKAAR